jgi:hypothetical protein
MRKLSLALIFAVALGWPALLLAQTDTPTVTATATPTATVTATGTITPTPALANLTTREGELLESYDPALKQAALATKIQSLITAVNTLTTASGVRVKQVKTAATNATALGLSDVGTVISIVAFTTSSGAIAAKGILAEGAGADYTVAAGDVTPVGDHSSQTWVITYTTH